jgi:hypothetical protein
VSGPFDLYLFLAQEPLLMCLAMAITATIMAAKS